MRRENLKRARIKAGLTQQELADKLGLSLIGYTQIERGLRGGQFEIWDKLEDIFGMHQRVLRAQRGQPSRHSLNVPPTTIYIPAPPIQERSIWTMTEKEVLQEVYDDLMDKVFVRSDNYRMTKPKRGCEDEFKHYKEMADIVKAILDRT